MPQWSERADELTKPEVQTSHSEEFSLYLSCPRIKFSCPWGCLFTTGLALGILPSLPTAHSTFRAFWRHFPVGGMHQILIPGSFRDNGVQLVL
jgi:hypothetical protein